MSSVDAAGLAKIDGCSAFLSLRGAKKEEAAFTPSEDPVRLKEGVGDPGDPSGFERKDEPAKKLGTDGDVLLVSDPDSPALGVAGVTAT